MSWQKHRRWRGACRSPAFSPSSPLFFERVLLNFMLGNGDAHLKNFSMLETDGGALRLSPAYDLVCSKAVIPREMDCALTLNGRPNKLSRRDFEQFADTLNIPPKALRGILERFSQGFPILLRLIACSRLSDDLQERIRRVMEERHRRLFARPAAVSAPE